MTPRSSCPGGESTPLRGATSGSHYEINNVTETAVGISRGRHPERGYGLSYSPPGSFLESTGGSVLTRAEGLPLWLGGEVRGRRRGGQALPVRDRKIDGRVWIKGQTRQV